MAGNSENTGRRSGVSRRTFVKAAGASGVATGLAGCIYGDDGGGDGNTVVWGYDPTAVQEASEDIKQLYHDNGLSDDITIEFRAGANDTGARRSNYVELLNAGETEPDLMLMDNGWVNVFIQNGLIANLSEELDESELQTIEDQFFEGFTATARDPNSGDLFGVPYFPDFPTMQYRKDFARQAGYSDSDFEQWATEPMTWEEWSHLTKEITENSDAQFGLATQWANYNGTSCCTFNEVMSSWGGAYFGGRDNLFGPVGERPVTVNEPEVINSLRMMRTFTEGVDQNFQNYATNIAPSEITSWQEEDARQRILNGEAVMQRNWPYAINLNAGELGTDAYGAMPIPYAVPESEAAQPGTGGTTSALGGWHIVLNPNSENKEAALEVMRTAMKDDTYLGMLELWGWLPPKPELFESETATNIEPMGQYMDTLKLAGENVMPRPVTQVWPNEASVIAQQANTTVAGSKSASQAMADLQSELEDIESG
ncbi:extracellular solute-binding protein [Halostella sp. JP-L12]|uniref:substrate-binding domain-containing protein n=1 Tax=Halostella TaxID=1843185 RepID=UPI000EF808AF|nr:MULTISPECIES: substrate-binding domain-containing protein [Halostella]NHN48607.1 extracellular solute-binding protein [Halostella sp. JP-L12]